MNTERHTTDNTEINIYRNKSNNRSAGSLESSPQKETERLTLGNMTDRDMPEEDIMAGIRSVYESLGVRFDGYIQETLDRQLSHTHSIQQLQQSISDKRRTISILLDKISAYDSSLPV